MISIQKISDSEMEVMKVIWDSEISLTSAQILEVLNKDKSWKPTTVFTFLARLEKKGVVKNKKIGRAKQYIATLTEDEYKSFETKTFLDEVHKGSIKSFMAALIDSNDISTKELEEIKKWFLNK